MKDLNNVTDDEKLSKSLLTQLKLDQICDDTDVVRLHVERSEVLESISKQLDDSSKADSIVDTVMRARYINLYQQMGETFTENEYIEIVENQILVDMQGRKS